MIRFCIFFGVLSTGVAAQAQDFSSGLLIPTEEMVGAIPRVIPKARGIDQLAREKDLSAMMPIPGDQGIKNMSCTGWAACYGLLTYLKAVEKKWLPMADNKRVNPRHVFCPTYLYNQITKFKGCEEGAFLELMLKAMQSHGGVPLANCPVTCGFNKEDLNLVEIASQYRILSYRRLHDKDLHVEAHEIKSELSGGNPVLIGMYVDQDVLKSDKYGDGKPNMRVVWSHDPDAKITYHAMVIVGYSDSTKAFKVLNSYGPTRKNGGYLWVSYPTLSTMIREAFVVDNRPADLKLVDKASGLLASSSSVWPNESLTATYNWIKAGYYRIFANFRVACVNLDRRSGSAVIKISELVGDGKSNEIYTFKTSVKDEVVEFRYKNYLIGFKMDKIEDAGKNPFKKALFYKFSVKESISTDGR
jgi:hypothetical protein